MLNVKVFVPLPRSLMELTATVPPLRLIPPENVLPVLLSVDVAPLFIRHAASPSDRAAQGHGAALPARPMPRLLVSVINEEIVTLPAPFKVIEGVVAPLATKFR